VQHINACSRPESAECRNRQNELLPQANGARNNRAHYIEKSARDQSHDRATESADALRHQLQRWRMPPLHFVFSSVPNQNLGPLLPYINRNIGNTYHMLGADHAWRHKMFEEATAMIRRLGSQTLGTEFTIGTETNFPPDRTNLGQQSEGIAIRIKGRGVGFHS